MTFGEFKNTVFINTKLKVYNGDGEYLGLYKLNQIIKCDNHIVDAFWALDEGIMGIQLVKE
jgi:hypothetical protein